MNRQVAKFADSLKLFMLKNFRRDLQNPSTMSDGDKYIMEVIVSTASTLLGSKLTVITPEIILDIIVDNAVCSNGQKANKMLLWFMH